MEQVKRIVKSNRGNGIIQQAPAERGETAKKYTKEEIENILDKLSDEKKYGTVLRAKGIVDNAEGDEWLHFDYVPGESDVRNGSAGVIGRICVIGSKINEDAVKQLFGII